MGYSVAHNVFGKNQHIVGHSLKEIPQTAMASKESHDGVQVSFVV